MGLALVGLALTSCGRQPLATEAERATAGADVAFALTGAPPEVRCLQITAATTETRKLPLVEIAPGGQEVTARALPLGVVVLTVEAFSSTCAAVAPSSVPSWLGGPKTVRLVPGANLVEIVMRPNTQVTVRVGFEDGGASCAAAASACVSDGDCCTGLVCSGGGDGGAGTCAPPATPSTGPGVDPASAVDLTLNGGLSYLVYPAAGGGACTAGAGDARSPFAVAVPAGQTVCVDPNLVAVPILTTPQLCTAGHGCATCTNAAACGPASCFAAPPPLPAGAMCRTLGSLAPQGVTWYLLVQPVKSLPADEQTKVIEGLPRVIQLDVTATLRLAPPHDDPHFVFTRLGSPVNPPPGGGDSCGGRSLCGIVQFASLLSGLPGWAAQVIGGGGPIAESASPR